MIDHFPDCDVLRQGAGYCLCDDRRASQAMKDRNIVAAARKFMTIGFHSYSCPMIPHCFCGYDEFANVVRANTTTEEER